MRLMLIWKYYNWNLFFSCSCFGQNLQPSSYIWEDIFVILITVSGLVFILFLIGNMQVGTYLYICVFLFLTYTSLKGSKISYNFYGRYFIHAIQIYLQSKTARSEEMRLKGREIEQWMGFGKLSEDLQGQVKKYQRYIWRETQGVDVQNLLNNLPKDLRRKIKSELCLELVKKVSSFLPSREFKSLVIKKKI